MKNKAIFLDKDGTLIPDIPYNVNPAKVTLQPFLTSGLKRLQQAGYLLIIVSNQSGIAKGYFTEDDLINVRDKIDELFSHKDLKLQGFYYCPHHPKGTVVAYSLPCNCRKPLPGLLLTAAQEQEIDLKNSWMIGDILNDVEAGNRANCRTVLINNGNETEWIDGEQRQPTVTCATIDEAADIILKQ